MVNLSVYNITGGENMIKELKSIEWTYKNIESRQ